MSSPLLVSCVLALYFFVIGCAQIAFFLSEAEFGLTAAWIAGLVGASWPLAVPAVALALVDAKMMQKKGKREEEPEENEIPEAPVRLKKEKEPTEERISYFNIAPMQAEPVQAAGAQQRPAAVAETPAAFFATPPPFQQAGVTPQRPAMFPESSSSATVPVNMALRQPVSSTTVPLSSAGARQPESPGAQQMPPAAPAESPAPQKDERQGGLNFFKL